jgi:uncharacterized membrane protein HdeD (DUF308 family)
MTTHVSDPASRTSAPRSPGRAVLIAVGVALLAVGVVLLFNPVAAARTLALLIGLSLVLGGCLELAAARSDRTRWSSVALGLVLIVGGIVAAFWPGITLWALAVITAVTLIVHGAVRVGIAVTARDTLPHWGWLVLAGAVNVLVGVLALAWPEATVLVLSLLLGIQVLMFGGFLLAAGLVLPRSTAATPP